MNWKRIAAGGVAVVALVVAVGGGLLWSELRGDPIDAVEAHNAPAPAFSDAQVARGEYLARLGNCAGCHTARGGAAYAGGRAIATPFGAIYAGNLTPDRATGIGGWSPAAFYRALHEGRSRDGRLLYPAFPYPNMTRVTRDDSDAIYAYLLRKVPPVSQVNTAPALRFPYDSALALAAWRLLYFKPDAHRDDPAQPAAWNRGAYLVQGLAHCGACHSTRNALGAPLAGHAYDGAMMPLNDWYAPSLTSPAEASVAGWALTDIADWLRSGSTAKGSALGPMAEVVFQSTQYASNDDLTAMATYLKSLPASVSTADVEARARDSKPLIGSSNSNDAGPRLYREHCASCHGDNGEGKAGAFPVLAGNRTVTMTNPSNLVRVILAGGFAPATAANPRPHGMPPFYHLLSDADIARLATHLRSSWGNAAPPVSELDMVKYRNALIGSQ